MAEASMVRDGDGGPPKQQSLYLGLADVVPSEDLGALLFSAADFYSLHLRLAEKSYLALDRAMPLIVAQLEIGTPNFIRWLGESKHIKALERVLQAAAAVARSPGTR